MHPRKLLVTSIFLPSHAESHLTNDAKYIQTSGFITNYHRYSSETPCSVLAIELNSSTIRISTYTPWHEVGEAPVVLFVEEKMADPPAEGFLIIFVIDDLQHGLCVTRPWPEQKTQGFGQSIAQWVEMPMTFSFFFSKNQVEVHTWSLIRRCTGGRNPRSSGAAGQGRTAASPWSSTAGFWRSMTGWAPTHSGGWIVPPHSGRLPRTASWCLEGRKVRGEFRF